MPSLARLGLQTFLLSQLASPVLGQDSSLSLPQPTPSVDFSIPPDSPIGDPTPAKTTTGDEDNGTTTTSLKTKTTSALTTVVSIFYINVQGDEERGMAYTALHRNAGSVMDVDDSATTYVITGTRTTPRETVSLTVEDPADSPTSLPASLASATAKAHHPPQNRNRTGIPSTITQGPRTFLFTIERGEDRTVVNRCQLDGLTWATCDLTHIGKGWYTRRSPDFNGDWSTYNYTWTSGDRFGFAPVTITAGVQKLPGPGEGASGDGDPDEGAAGGRVFMMRKALTMGFVMGGFAILGIL